jgi:hypothetical protein
MAAGGVYLLLVVYFTMLVFGVIDNQGNGFKGVHPVNTTALAASSIGGAQAPGPVIILVPDGGGAASIASLSSLDSPLTATPAGLQESGVATPA